MKDFIIKYWFFVGIGAAILLAFNFPELWEKVRQWRLMRGAIFITFLMTGLTLESRKIVSQLRNIKPLLVALLSGFVFFPVVALLLSKYVFVGDADFMVGVCILAVAPVTIASGAVMTAMSGGNVALSLFICVVSNFLAIFTMPFSLKLLLGYEQGIDLPVLGMIGKLIVLVLLPTVIGQMLRIWLKDMVQRCRKGFSIFSQLVVLLIIFNAFSSPTPLT